MAGVTQPPKERINIKFTAATGGKDPEVELPLKMLFLGDFTGREDKRSLAERKPINVDKLSFEKVLSGHAPSLEIAVPDKLSAEPGDDLPVRLTFQALNDFTPDAIAAQVPQLKKLMELRDALTALKGPFGNAAIRRKLQAWLDDKDTRARLLGELGVGQSPAPDAGPTPDAPTPPKAGS